MEGVHRLSAAAGRGLRARCGVHTAAPGAWAVLIALAGLGMPLTGHAQDAAARACVGMADDAQRLACFDRAHGRPSSTPSAYPAAGTASASTPVGTAPSGGPLGRAWALGEAGTPFRLSAYRPLYILPFSATDNINRRPDSPAPGHSTGVELPNRSVEAKFQISAKTLAWRGAAGDVWIGYTQSSRWQLYQGDISRPFRETNYEPEVIYNRPVDFELLGWRARMAGVSLSHQSNGRALPLSRSWNRVIGHLGFERDAWSLVVRPWVRIGESAAQDDNPDIEDHLGRADLTLRHEGEAGHLLSLRLRHTLRGGARSRGAGELEWAFPLTGRLHGFVQVFSGYGESLIDYNIHQTRLGLGFSLAGWH